jgi:hypothetical protein
MNDKITADTKVRVYHRDGWLALNGERFQTVIRPDLVTGISTEYEMLFDESADGKQRLTGISIVMLLDMTSGGLPHHQLFMWRAQMSPDATPDDAEDAKQLATDVREELLGAVEAAEEFRRIEKRANNIVDQAFPVFAATTLHSVVSRMLDSMDGARRPAAPSCDEDE